SSVRELRCPWKPARRSVGRDSALADRRHWRSSRSAHPCHERIRLSDRQSLRRCHLHPCPMKVTRRFGALVVVLTLAPLIYRTGPQLVVTTRTVVRAMLIPRPARREAFVGFWVDPTARLAP